MADAPSTPGIYVGQHQDGYFWNGTSWDQGETIPSSTAPTTTPPAPTTNPPGPQPPKDFTNRAYNFYLTQNWSPTQAAALAGNAHWESGGNPNAIHDNGTGLGLFGWRDPTQGSGRKTDLINWANDPKKHGGVKLDPNDETTQLKFSQYELTDGGEKASGTALKNSTDLTGAQNAVMGYLRPQGYTPDNPQGGHGYANRYNNAAALTGDARMAVPPGSGGGGNNVVMTAGSPTAPLPPFPTTTPSPDTGLLAASAAAQQQSEEAKQQAKYAAIEKEGMGLLGQAVTPAPAFKGGGAQVVVPRQPGVPMPDFIQMLAQQRLQRGV